MKQMPKSTLNVQTNSKSLKAIKIIDPWIYPGRKESTILARLKQKPYHSESNAEAIFTPHCSFWTTAHGDFEFYFICTRSHKNLQATKYQIPHGCLNERRNSTNILTSQHYFFNSTRGKFVRNWQYKHGSFSLVLRIDVQPFIDLYRTHLHFDDKVSTALAHSRHKKCRDIAQEGSANFSGFWAT